MPLSWPPNGASTYGSVTSDDEPQFIHCSGGMFILIPNSKALTPRNKDGTHKNPAQKRISATTKHIDYITRHRSRNNSFNEGVPYVEERVGFLWTWNFMLTKRWRSVSTGDEHFQDKMLADFRAFCSNEHNRLHDYWNMCVSSKQSE